MTARTFAFAIIAATVANFGLSAAVAQAQTRVQTPAPQRVQPQGPQRIVGPSPDLVPIPSRIEHGVVSVRNAGASASAPSLVTVNCHLPGHEGGCPDIPPALIAAYENPAYPNRLVVQVPAIQPGHVHNHTLTFWDDVTWPAGSYQFDYVADAGAVVAESNEGNNSASYTWTVP